MIFIVPGCNERTGGMRGHTQWSDAAMASLHCLMGCAIGEVIGMSIGVMLGLSLTGKMMLSIPLAFLAGYALTIWGMRRMGFLNALMMALASDTISIIIMEIVDNLVMIVIPRSMSTGLLTIHYWASLLTSLTIAFLIATPANKWLISRGLGHQHHMMAYDATGTGMHHHDDMTDTDTGEIMSREDDDMTSSSDNGFIINQMHARS